MEPSNALDAFIAALHEQLALKESYNKAHAKLSQVYDDDSDFGGSKADEALAIVNPDIQELQAAPSNRLQVRGNPNPIIVPVLYDLDAD